MVDDSNSSEQMKSRQGKHWVRIAGLAGGAIVSVILVMVMTVFALGHFFGNNKQADIVKTTENHSGNTSSSISIPLDDHLRLDVAKNYGDKYKDGVLPVGDKKYATTGAKQGYIYACSGYARNLESGNGGGAGKQGPWFSSDGTTYDINKKAHVNGAVTWKSTFSNTVNGATRTITSNDLPDHVTGIFPIKSSDPAYAYDRNPNSISGQDISYALPSNPTYGNPNCIGGQVGIMLTGVALFSGFDADGRDAGAWEVQDDCGGHPEKTGEYHYHTLSSCIKDTSVQTVIGFALDGFPITGPKVGEGNILTTSDLDECHGITNEIILDGKRVTRYHYVMTEDFPYSISCFRGAAVQTAGPEQGNQQPPQQGQQPPRQ